jgi:nitrous oxide reductase
MSDTPRKGQSMREDRRRFLLGLAAAGGGAAAVAAGQSVAADSSPADDSGTDPAERRGYQETQHVRDYYRTASI